MTMSHSAQQNPRSTSPAVVDLAEAEDLKLQQKTGKSYSQGALIRMRFFRHKAAMVSLVVLAFIALMAFTSIGFAGIPGWWDESYSAASTVVDGGRPTLSVVPQFLGGEGLRWGAHPFGQTSTGTDFFALVMRGTQQSLIIAFIVGLISTAIGALVGAASAYFGGWVDSVLMRLTDLIIVIPLLVLAAVLGKMAGGLQLGILPLAFVLGIVSWTSLARLVRGEILSLREKEFVAAAVAMGAKPGRIIGKHLLPNTIGVIVVNATFAIAGAVLLETSLSFLGFGVKAPDSSLGLLISLYQNSFTTRPWLFWWPGMIILAIALSVNFLGDGLRDAFDPRQGAAAGRKRGLFSRRAAKTDAGATTAGGLGTAPTARDGEADDLIADPDAPEHRRGGAGGPAGGVGQ